LWPKANTAAKIEKVVENLSLMIDGNASGGITADKSETGCDGTAGNMQLEDMFVYFLLTAPGLFLPEFSENLSYNIYHHIENKKGI